MYHWQMVNIIRDKARDSVPAKMPAWAHSDACITEINIPIPNSVAYI